MFAYGDQQFAYLDLGPGIDADYVASLRTESGYAFGDLLGLVNGAMSAVNSRRDPLIATLLYETTSPIGRARRTMRKFVQRGGEYTVARPQRGAGVSSMLPIVPHEISTAWTERGLKRIDPDRFRDELQDMVDAWQAIYIGETLDRLFSPNEFSVDDNLTTALSPGFAGSGTGSNIFSGIFPDGTPIPGGYTHYGVIKKTPAATMDSGLLAMHDLLKRWHPGPYELIGTDAAVKWIRANSLNFVDATSNLIAVGANTDRALVDPTTYLGVWNGDVKVRVGVPQLGSTFHLAMYVTFGAFNPNNILAWRTYANESRNVVVNSRSMYPLDLAVARQDYGIGVSDRVGACIMYMDDAAGAYVAPTGILM